MARKTDNRSLWMTRKHEGEIECLSFEDLHNPYNRYSLLLSDKSVFVKWLQTSGLLPSSVTCHRCHEPCKLNGRSRNIDGFTWRYPGWP
jgi:hypothetical protein